MVLSRRVVRLPERPAVVRRDGGHSNHRLIDAAEDTIAAQSAADPTRALRTADEANVGGCGMDGGSDESGGTEQEADHDLRTGRDRRVGHRGARPAPHGPAPTATPSGTASRSATPPTPPAPTVPTVPTATVPPTTAARRRCPDRHSPLTRAVRPRRPARPAPGAGAGGSAAGCSRSRSWWRAAARWGRRLPGGDAAAQRPQRPEGGGAGGPGQHPGRARADRGGPGRDPGPDLTAAGLAADAASTCRTRRTTPTP